VSQYLVHTSRLLAKMTQDFRHELGQMTQVGERHSYPLIGVHAKTLIAKRFALLLICLTIGASLVNSATIPLVPKNITLLK
jgi:hypothetical protein